MEETIIEIVQKGYNELGLLLLPQEIFDAYEKYKESRDFVQENGIQLEYRPKQTTTKRFNKFFNLCQKQGFDPMEVINQLEPFRG